MLRVTIMCIVLLVLLASLFAGCGGGHQVIGPAPYVPIPIIAGTPQSHALTGLAGQTIVADVAGATLVLPDGAIGEMTVAPITSGPSYPITGAQGIQYTVPTGTHVQVHITVPAGQAAHCYVFGALAGCIDESNVPRSARWVPITDGTLNGSTYTFDVPNDPQSRMDRTTGAIAIGTTPQKPDRITAIEQQIRGYIATAIATLPAAQQNAARTNYEGALAPSFGESSEREGSYYTGFGWYFTDRVVPYFGMRLTSSADVMQHETGHYLNHLLAGSAGFRPILNLAPDENHVIGSVYGGRTTITEEYAYYVQYLLGDMVNGGKPNTGYWLASQLRRTPSQTDYPSVEGFGCSLMAALTRANADDMYDFASVTTKTKVPTPAGALTKGEVLAVYADGATSIDALANALETRMQAKGQAAAFQVIAERLGWSHRATGHVLSDRLPVKGVKITPVVSVTRNGVTTEYTTPSVTTDIIGGFTLPRVFFGRCTLRLEYGGKTYEAPCTIDRTLSTITYQTIPDIDIAGLTAPSVASVAPDTAPAGQIVVIRGTHFGDTEPNDGGVFFRYGDPNAPPDPPVNPFVRSRGRVYLNTRASVVSWSDTEIAVEVPAGLDEPRQVVVMQGRESDEQVYFYGGDGSRFYLALRTMNSVSVDQVDYDITTAWSAIVVQTPADFNTLTSTSGVTVPLKNRSFTWNGNTFTAVQEYSQDATGWSRLDRRTITGTVDPVRRRLTHVRALWHVEYPSSLAVANSEKYLMDTELELADLAGDLRGTGVVFGYVTTGYLPTGEQGTAFGFPPVQTTAANVVKYSYTYTNPYSGTNPNLTLSYYPAQVTKTQATWTYPRRLVVEFNQ